MITKTVLKAAQRLFLAYSIALVGLVAVYFLLTLRGRSISSGDAHTWLILFAIIACAASNFLFQWKDSDRLEEMAGKLAVCLTNPAQFLLGFLFAIYTMFWPERLSAALLDIASVPSVGIVALMIVIALPKTLRRSEFRQTSVLQLQDRS